jgi:hypothetical protein
MKMQKSNWLTATSFEDAIRLVAAINDLSTYAKLKVAGIRDTDVSGEVVISRQTLTEFLNRFQSIVQMVETDERQPILGTDPRSGELVRKYLAQKKKRAKSSGLYVTSLPRLVELVQSEDMEMMPELIECLSDLRELVEQHSHTDVNNLLGEL